MKKIEELLGIKYFLKIKDPVTNRECNVYMSTESDLEFLLLLLKPATGLQYDVKDLKKDSLDITEEDRMKILETCEKADSDKIIITHGTDTMIETAKILNKIRSKTIILTGAVKPEKFSDSDASFNVGTAVGAIPILKNGIYIAMNGKITSWGNVQRNLGTGQFSTK